MAACKDSSLEPQSSSSHRLPRVSLADIVEHGRHATRADSGGRLARARLRHAVLTVLPDQIVRGALSRRHFAEECVLRRIEVSVPTWPARFDGVRIGHISDLHVGDLMPAPRAIEAIERLAGAKPDLVACTGDIIDLDVAGSEPVFKALGAMRAPLGRFFVLGNHDLLDNARKVLRLAQSSGLTTLRSRTVEVKGGLRVAGIDWSRTIEGNAEQVKHVAHETAVPHLLLAHNPKAFRAASRLRVPLTLAGHTHGGQFALSPKRKQSRAATERALRAGHYHDGDAHLFVTTGVGGWFPLRVNCPPEVVVITVRRGSGAMRSL